MAETTNTSETKPPAPVELPTPAKGPTREQKRILVVEDNSINSRLALMLLEKLGFTAEVAANGELGVERFLAGNFAAILMDCHMPVMDGYHATSRIREIEAAPDWKRGRIHIIAMTANAMAGERERCLACGMDDYITKPVKPAILGEALSELATRMKVSEAAPTEARDYSYEGARETICLLARELSSNAVADLLESWIQEAPVRFLALKAMIAGQDREQSGREAHSLRGMAAVFGLRRIEQCCQHLEDLASGPPTERELEIADELIREGAAAPPVLMNVLDELRNIDSLAAKQNSSPPTMLTIASYVANDGAAA